LANLSSLYFKSSGISYPVFSLYSLSSSSSNLLAFSIRESISADKATFIL
jgi:hypothetical protein